MRGLEQEELLRVWQPISTAPFDRALQLAVVDADEAHALAFACWRVLGGWINAETRSPVDVHPTHWRQWQDNP